MLHFNPQTGLYPDEITTVRENVAKDWKNAFRGKGLPELATGAETPAGQLIDSQTAAIVDKDNELLFLAGQFNPLTSQGIWQDALGKIYFLTRKMAQASEALCECTGLYGTVIPAGARIRSIVDNTEWESAENVTIPQAGNVSVRFLSVEPGETGAGANTLTQIVTVIPGWDRVTNPHSAIVGNLTESQLEFETRRYASVAVNARGSLASLYGSIANIPNVIDLVILENTTNKTISLWGVEIEGHSVWIAVTGGKNEEIAEAIYRKKDAGCGTCGNTLISYQDDNLPYKPCYSYKIERPEPVNFAIRVIYKVGESAIQGLENKIRAQLLSDFNGDGKHENARIGTAQKVYASRFYCAVLEAGVQNLISVELSFPADSNIWSSFAVINADQMPVLDADNIIIEAIP